MSDEAEKVSVWWTRPLPSQVCLSTVPVFAEGRRSQAENNKGSIDRTRCTTRQVWGNTWLASPPNTHTASQAVASTVTRLADQMEEESEPVWPSAKALSW